VETVVQPLIDADILRYEIGFSGEYKEEGSDDVIIREWDFVQELLDNRINHICREVEATVQPIIFLTGNNHSVRVRNRICKYSGEVPIEMVRPFREDVAVTKPYKGTRVGAKPYHFDNITAYLLANYNCDVAYGVEADDRMALLQSGQTIICSRDKDLRMVDGWHYGWECGKQASFGPELISRKGWLRLDERDETKIRGGGLKFFFYQMLVGDAVDNIPGCPKVGPKKAFPLLEACKTKRDHEEAVIECYKKAYGEGFEEKLEEQSKLLWMIRELNEDGSPIHYEWKF
jgi:hypothetical protein